MGLLEDNQRLRQERDLLRRRLAELEEGFARSNREVFEMNEAQVQVNARLSELDRMKDTFLSMITHEDYPRTAHADDCHDWPRRKP